MRKLTLFLLTSVIFFPFYLLSQDENGDGIFDDYEWKSDFLPGQKDQAKSEVPFSQYWESPPGMFSNVYDVEAGYFDSDTLLDIACYTWTTVGTFYIYEQSPTAPNDFVVVFQYNKLENGAFGAIVAGDTDGDGLTEIITSDFSTLSRIYIFENVGNNSYVSKETQNTLTHAAGQEQPRHIHIADLNNNGKKEIILSRSKSAFPITAQVYLWEQNGAVGANSYTNLYTYGGSMYIFGRGGVGDSDDDGYDEVFISYGGIGNTAINITRIEYNPSTSTFQLLTTPATPNGLPMAYQVADVNNDGTDELVMTAGSTGKASTFVFQNTGPNSYQLLYSIQEELDNNQMLCLDVINLDNQPYPSILCGSFNANIYVYSFNGAGLEKQYEDTELPSGAIRRVIWTDVNSQNGFVFQNGNTVRLYKRDPVSPQGISLHLKAFLEGPFETTEMTTDLNILGIIPLNQPYNTSPWNYSGSEIVTVLPNPDVVDWILVELRETTGDASTATSSTAIAKRAGFLLNDGTIVELDGVSPLNLDVEVTQNLFTVIYHRNHAGVLSSVPLIPSGNSYTYDFTSNANTVYGGSLGYKELAPGIWGMMAGNGSADVQINNIDKNDVWYGQLNSNGYLNGDFDMNGTVNTVDNFQNWNDNAGHQSFIP